MAVNLDGFGYNESVDVSTTKTLAITDQGIVQNVTASTVLTLPATVVGYCFIVRVGKAGLTVQVSPNSVDLIAGNNFTATDDKDAIATNQPAGSLLQIVGNGTTGWNIQRIKGTWTRE